MEKLDSLIHWICRLILGCFFVVAGFLKCVDPAVFQQEILAYQIVGYPLSFVAAHFLPFIEIALGLGVVVGWKLRFALTGIAVLLFVFIAALSWTWFQGIDIQCGCLGKIDFIEGQPAAIARDVVLLLMAFFLFVKPARQRNSAGEPSESSETRL